MKYRNIKHITIDLISIVALSRTVL